MNCSRCGATMARFENPERWICPNEPHPTPKGRPGLKEGVKRKTDDPKDSGKRKHR